MGNVQSINDLGQQSVNSLAATNPSNVTFPDSVQQFYTSNNLPSSLPLSYIPVDMNQDLTWFDASQNMSSLTMAQQLNSYLLQFSSPPNGGGQTKPANYSTFATNFYTFEGFSDSADASILASSGGFYQGILQDFTTITGVPTSDWSLLNSSISFSDATSSNNPLIVAFNKFLTQYTPPSLGPSSNLNYYANFINQWQQYLKGSSSSIAVPIQSSANTPGLSYESYYMAYAKNPTEAGFQAAIQAFYTSEVSKNGVFLPNQAFADWTSKIQSDSGFDLEGISSLAGNDSAKAIILNQIILLLISIIQTLQDVGIAQANRLTYITQYQNAYTGLQTQIPVFLSSNAAPIGGTGTDASSARNDLNSSFNGILTDNLRSLRGIQEDNAKKLQANVNTTNDAVNQQTDMATTFLQQLTTLLGTILR